MELVLRRVLDTWTARYDAYIDKWILALHLSRGWVLFSSLFSLVSGTGLLFAVRANFRGTWPLALCTVLIPVPYYITHSSLRYRHPIDPLLTLFAVYATFRGYAYFRRGSEHSS